MEIRIDLWQEFLQKFESAWRALFEQAGSAPDQGPDWFLSLVEGHDLDEGRVFVAYAMDDSALSFVMPYSRETTSVFGLRVTALRPLSSHHCLHNRLLCSAPAETVAVSLIRAFGERHKWHVLQVDKLVEGDASANAWLSAAHELGLWSSSSPGEAPPFLTHDAGWDDYLASRSSNFRYNIKRKRKALEKLGEIEVEAIDADSDFDACFEAIIEIEKRSWKQEAGTSITSRSWERKFYELLLPKLHRAGLLQTLLLRLDGRAVAHDISAISGAAGYSLKTSYDASLEKASPGAVLRPIVLEHLLARGVVEYDFLGSSERYKRQFGNGSRQEFNLLLLNHGAQGRLIRMRRRLRSLASRLRKGSEAE